MENASAATDSKPEKGGLKSRMVSLGYRFQEGKSNSGFLDFSNNKVHVQYLKKKEMETDESFFENARFIESLRHCSFLGNRFIDPINESELYLVSDPFDCTLTERIEQLKDKGILFYMFFELPCLHEKGGIKYTEIPPIYRNMVKMLIDGLFFLHEEKGKCTNGFTLGNLVIVRDVVCLNIINFVEVSDENRARDMHCLKMILDGWFPDRVVSTEKIIHSSGDVLKKNLHDSPHTQLSEFGYLPQEILLSPASMLGLRKQLGRFYYLLRKYQQHHRQSLKSFFSNHIAIMDPTKRLQFIKNCRDKSNSRKFHATQYRNALKKLGNMNGWVGKGNISHGPLLDVLTKPIVLSREENIKASMRYTTSGLLDKHYGDGPPKGNFLVNRSLVAFWRNSGTHLQDHMPDHLAAKRARIEEIKMMLVEKERKRLRLKASWKELKKPFLSEKEKNQKENDLKIFDDVDVELTIMSV